MKEKIEKDAPSNIQALVGATLAEIWASGSFDEEPDILNNILKRYEEGEIDERQAAEEVRALVAGRQDYH